MAQQSDIEWTDGTWPIVQGCSYESPGCKNCYAVPVIWRLAHNPIGKIAKPLQGLVEERGEHRVWTGKVALRRDRLDWPLTWKKPQMIFVPSHGDLFHEDVPDDFIDKVFAVIALTPRHTYQVLTKRAARMRAYFEGCDLMKDLIDFSRPWYGLTHWHRRGGVSAAIESLISKGFKYAPVRVLPLPNVWLGVSTEDQARADERIPHLLATPAAKRFLSAEPLLGPIDLNAAWHGECALSAECWGDCRWCDKGYPPLHNCRAREGLYVDRERSGLDWVIVGGESGPGARPLHPQWVRTLREQCQGAGVPFFFKQWGNWRPPLDGETYDTSKGRAGAPPAFIVAYDGTVHCFHPEGGGEVMLGVGKKAAGATLDGVEHRAMP